MSFDKSLNKHLNSALESLDSAMTELFVLLESGDRDTYEIGKIGRSVGLIREFQESIFERNPELRPAPVWENWEEPILTKEEEEIVTNLSSREIVKIDDGLLSYASPRFQKVAKIVGSFMLDSTQPIANLSDTFYAMRVESLVERGKLESQGNLKFMRYSEVRVPKT